MSAHKGLKKWLSENLGLMFILPWFVGFLVFKVTLKDLIILVLEKISS